ncbi:MAG: hypothetical protein H6619_03185 [Deltaproteobacteria bacterium]|nr:hypothetical protein [Deltaproteobacteria bacterium]
MKRDATITWASGEGFFNQPGFEVYIQSILRSGFEGDKLIFTTDIPEKWRERLNQLGFNIVTVNPQIIEVVVRDRFLAYWMYLAENAERYRYIIATDARDVIFQRNPIPYLSAKFLPHSDFVLLTSEGMKHCESDWNMRDQYGCQKNVKRFVKDYRNWPVINGGIQLGTAKQLKDFFFTLWSATLMTNGECTDQGVLNYILSFLEKDPNIFIDNPAKSVLCATGEVIKNKLMDPMPLFENHQVINSNTMETYILYHQWDRTSHAEELQKHYIAQDQGPKSVFPHLFQDKEA